MKKGFIALTAVVLLVFSGCDSQTENSPEKNAAVNQLQTNSTGKTNVVHPETTPSQSSQTDASTQKVQNVISEKPASFSTTAKESVIKSSASAQKSDPQTQKSSPVSAAQPDAAKQQPINVEYGVVAKSDNAVTGTEKQEILNRVDNEINNLLGNIDGLETVSEADLQAN